MRSQSATDVFSESIIFAFASASVSFNLASAACLVVFASSQLPARLAIGPRKAWIIALYDQLQNKRRQARIVQDIAPSKCFQQRPFLTGHRLWRRCKTASYSLRPSTCVVCCVGMLAYPNAHVPQLSFLQSFCIIYCWDFTARDDDNSIVVAVDNPDTLMLLHRHLLKFDHANVPKVSTASYSRQNQTTGNYGYRDYFVLQFFTFYPGLPF